MIDGGWLQRWMDRQMERWSMNGGCIDKWMEDGQRVGWMDEAMDEEIDEEEMEDGQRTMVGEMEKDGWKMIGRQMQDEWRD